MGKLIVIEGLDGSGKATQASIFLRNLKQQGLAVHAITFPDYSSKSSTLVQMYLNGEIGRLEEINAFAASSFYSMDRFISYQTQWKQHYLDGKIILADRYTTSNLSHQMAKLPKDQWESFIDWLMDYEYTYLELPAPNLVLYLDMPPEVSRKLLTQRYRGDETKKDLHEKNFAYMLQCREAGLFAAQRLGWQVIPCCDSQCHPLRIEDISKKIDIHWKNLI